MITLTFTVETIVAPRMKSFLKERQLSKIEAAFSDANVLAQAVPPQNSEISMGFVPMKQSKIIIPIFSYRLQT